MSRKNLRLFSSVRKSACQSPVDDKGVARGIENPAKACLDIEHKINDSISPQPDYAIAYSESDGIIELKVNPGMAKPYLYKEKAYRRNGTSTIEVDHVEFSRLVLEGKNLSFEQLTSSNQDLTFDYLGSLACDRIGIDTFDSNTLKTLNLLTTEAGFNNAAALLADSNEFPGVDLARFGENISIILKRAILQGRSILRVCDETIELFRDYYTYEEVTGVLRIKKELIPEQAFREALANALVHRAWDVPTPIRISLYSDKVEISSPGGLPAGISAEEYLSDRLSVLRNPILANVFFRLHIIEAFGTGIQRIRHAYDKSVVKPEFAIGENSLQVTLPLVQEKLNLTPEQEVVYRTLSRHTLKSMGDIRKGVGFSKAKTTRLVKELVDAGLVIVEGAGRGTRYRLRS